MLPALCADQAVCEPIQPPHAGACPPQNGHFAAAYHSTVYSGEAECTIIVCCADWIGGEPIQPAYAGAIAVWNPHASALHPYQCLPDIPKDRRRRSASVDAVVLQQRGAEHCGVSEAPGRLPKMS